MHSRGFIHRDIKPGNFCVDMNQHHSSSKLFIIDYGLAKKFVYDSTGEHISREPEKDKRLFVGSLRYCSINCIEGGTQSRKDDLESALYMIVEWASGDLPWKRSIRGPSTHATIKKIKTQLTAETLGRGLPKEIQTLFRYLRSLQFEDRPDYDSMVSILEQAKSNLKTTQYAIDWELMVLNKAKFV